jgi:hypothetical protein
MGRMGWRCVALALGCAVARSSATLNSGGAPTLPTKTHLHVLLGVKLSPIFRTASHNCLSMCLDGGVSVRRAVLRGNSACVELPLQRFGHTNAFLGAILLCVLISWMGVLFPVRVACVLHSILSGPSARHARIVHSHAPTPPTLAHILARRIWPIPHRRTGC